jgi:hypothetical protein
MIYAKERKRNDKTKLNDVGKRRLKYNEHVNYKKTAIFGPINEPFKKLLT